MASRLGSLFLTAALGPLQYAGQSIMSRRVDEGLQQIAGEDVLGAFERGVEAVAKEVGVKRADVVSLLPMDELRELADRIGKNQQIALTQWKAHAGPTGLLDGVADLTVDGRAPDASLCLLRLSRKMQADKHLSVPLRELSEDLDRWQQMLERCRYAIEDGDGLKRAHRQRTMVRGGIALAIAMAIAAAVVWVVRVQLARSRVDDALASEAPCEIRVEESDRDKASDEQLAALDRARERCEQQRRIRRRLEQARRMRQQALEAAARARRAREKRCASIATALRGGRAPELDGLAPEQRALLERLASAQFILEDARLGRAALPCAETRAHGDLAGRYVEAALTNLGTWMTHAILTEEAIALFSAGKEGVDEDTAVNFAQHADKFAKRALVSGGEERVRRAKTLCRAAEALGRPRRQYCRSLSQL